MEKKNIYPNVAQFLVEVASDPMKAFRALEVIGFTPPEELRKQAVYTRRYKRMSYKEALPDNLVFLQKTVFFQPKTQTPMTGFLLAQGGELPNIFLHGVAELIKPNDLTFPKDGYLRWRASAPITGKMVGYLLHNNGGILKIDPETMGLDSEVVDMQIIQTKGIYALHLLTKKGTVYGGLIENLQNNLIDVQQVQTGVNTILTVPHNDQTIKVFYGTDKGIIVNDDLLMNTGNHRVVDLVVDSEEARIFYKTQDGKIFAIPVDNNYSFTGTPIAINDVIKPTEQLFAGPNVRIGNQPALLLIDWDKDEHGHTYQRREITIPSLTPTAIPGNILAS
jgi:hypothetical protein